MTTIRSIQTTGRGAETSMGTRPRTSSVAIIKSRGAVSVIGNALTASMIRTVLIAGVRCFRKSTNGIAATRRTQCAE